MEHLIHGMLPSEYRTFCQNRELQSEKDAIQMSKNRTEEDNERWKALDRQQYLNSIGDPHADYNDEPIRKDR